MREEGCASALFAFICAPARALLFAHHFPFGRVACASICFALVRLLACCVRARLRPPTLPPPSQQSKQTQVHPTQPSQSVTIARRHEEAAQPAANRCLSLLSHALCVAPILVLARATLEAAKLLLLRLASLLFCATADADDPHTNKPRAAHETAAISTTATRDRSPHAAPHASTTGSSLSTPLLLLSGLSAMRDAEPTTSTSSTTTSVATHHPASQIVFRTSYSGVGESESMTIRHDASNGSGHSHSASSASSSSMQTSPSSSTGADDKAQQDPTDAITSPLLMSKGIGRRVKPFSGLNDGVSTHPTTQTTRSLTSQQDLGERRSSFCSMAADSRAQLRRRSHDFTDFTSMSLPPPGSSTGFLQARSKNHVHMRVYGRSDTETNKTLTARQGEGAALVDVVIPSTRTIWRRGQPVCIEWRVLDENVDTVQIELMEEGSSATTTIARAAPNSGFYTYPRVPWGMQCGPTYFLRISSTADPSRYMTTSFFQIGSAP